MRPPVAGHGRPRRAARGPRRSTTGKDAAGSLRRRARRSSRRRRLRRARRATATTSTAQPCHDPSGDGKGHPRSSAAGADRRRSTTTRLRAAARRPPLRHHHQRLGPDAGLPLADPAGRPLGDHRPRPRSCSSSARREGGGASEARRLQPEDRRRLGRGRGARARRRPSGSCASCCSREYRSPVALGPGAADAARAGPIADAAAAEDEGRPREAVRGGRLPRASRWSAAASRSGCVAQLHLLFAAFVLAVPIFALIIEFIGYRNGDKRYDELAHEFTKLLSVSFSLTATFGAFLTVHARSPLPEVHELPDAASSRRPSCPTSCCSSSRRSSSTRYYYGWGKFSPARPPAAGARPERRRHRDHADRQRLAHLHDDARPASPSRAR